MKIKTDMIKNEYLGDGVYANEGSFLGEIILTTGVPMNDDPYLDSPDAAIYLDPVVGKELYRYLKNIYE